MTPDDWATVRSRPDWREADLHDLRLRYAALLLDIVEHRRFTRQIVADDGEIQESAADARLWAVLDKERL